MSEERIVGMAEVADVTGVKPGTLSVMAYRGLLPEPDGMINGGRTKWWYRETITEWWAARQETGRE